ncbi:MAG: DM13 domain-containing protein [Actinophytocola sp.]|uniref:DM13 domain-containing protein n=1 Tax=Actinophytocola sp. TaxID=1872138 RepID=UPI003D6C5860
MRRLLRKPVTWVVLAVLTVGLVVGLALFEPWRAFTTSHVDEALPAPPAAAPAADDAPAAPAGPAELAEGAFVNGEHDTSGTARVLELPDGERILRLEGFSTSDGPDVRVWLSDTKAGADWGAFDDGRVVQLGELKATDGNHNYAIPAGADLEGLRSAVIWCDRFNVAFGSAPLAL